MKTKDLKKQAEFYTLNAFVALFEAAKELNFAAKVAKSEDGMAEWARGFVDGHLEKMYNNMRYAKKRYSEYATKKRYNKRFTNKRYTAITNRLITT